MTKSPYNPKSRPKAQPVKPSCATCVHVTNVTNDPPNGYCRRYPPNLVDRVTSTFPPVKPDWKCGEWRQV